MQTLWTVELSQEATEDYDHIIAYTAEHFGPAQALNYGRIIASSLAELSETGPSHPLASRRPELGDNLHSLPVRRRGKNARHILFFIARPTSAKPTLTVLRILHDSADCHYHL